MSTVKQFSLTSENLKRFEKELQEKKRKSKSLTRKIYNERTEGDGRSSGIQSYGSQLSAFKDSLNTKSHHVEAKKAVNSHNPSQPSRKISLPIHRPGPESVRRNPDGQSRNESNPTPHIVRIDYDEESDRIDYKTNSEDEDPRLACGDEKESSDDDDDDEDDDDDDDSDDDDDEDSEDESVESESEDESDSSDDDDDDDDDDDYDEEVKVEDEVEDDTNGTETDSKILRETPVSVRTHYSSSLNASTSSIPTIASVRSRPESIKTTKTERKGSVKSTVSSAPSYILNINQFRMKKMAVKQEKEREKLGIEVNESELSESSRNRSALSRMSMREKGTTSVQSKGSYVTVRNWTRWSTFSAAGYTISEGPDNNKFKRKRKTARRKTPTKTQSRSQVPHLPVISNKTVSKSQPDLQKARKRRVALTILPGLSNARPVSRSQMASRMSTRSIIKTPTMPRVKSVPDLNREAVMSFFEIERGANRSASRSGHRGKSSRAEMSSKSKQRKRQETDNDELFDFKNRRKRVLKRKERRRRERNDTYLSSALTVRPITRQHKKPSIDGGVSLTSALSVSIVKSSKSDKSRKTSSSASSKVSIISRKPRMQLLRTYAGYQSNASSRGSLFPPGTPISLILQRSPSLRSAITEYSSYLSLAASSIKSARPSSVSSLSSTGKYLLLN